MFNTASLPPAKVSVQEENSECLVIDLWPEAVPLLYPLNKEAYEPVRYLSGDDNINGLFKEYARTDRAVRALGRELTRCENVVLCDESSAALQLDLLNNEVQPTLDELGNLQSIYSGFRSLYMDRGNEISRAIQEAEDSLYMEALFHTTPYSLQSEYFNLREQIWDRVLEIDARLRDIASAIKTIDKEVSRVDEIVNVVQRIDAEVLDQRKMIKSFTFPRTTK